MDLMVFHTKGHEKKQWGSMPISKSDSNNILIFNNIIKIFTHEKLK